MGLANLGTVLIFLPLLNIFQHLLGWCIFQFYLLQLLDHGKDTENKTENFDTRETYKNVHHILSKVGSNATVLLAGP